MTTSAAWFGMAAIKVAVVSSFPTAPGNRFIASSNRSAAEVRAAVAVPDTDACALLTAPDI